MGQITIEKAKTLKRKLERDIAELLEDFQKETYFGYDSDSIKILLGNGGSHKRGFVIDVNVQVKL